MSHKLLPPLFSGVKILNRDYLHMQSAQLMKNLKLASNYLFMVRKLLIIHRHLDSKLEDMVYGIAKPESKK